MSRRRGHERSDAPPGLVAGGIAGLLGLLAIAALVAWGITAAYRAKAPPVQASAFDRAAAAPAGPRLEVHARADRILLESQAQKKLTGYGRSDQGPGLARIPIDRAMALEAAAGWPDADASSAPASDEERRP